MPDASVKVTEGAAAGAAPGRPRRRSLVLLLVLPLLLIGLVWGAMRLAGLTGWDAPAHLYKIALLQEGQSVFWDNNWYGGAYQIVSYGVVFYFLARIVTYSVLVIVSAGALPVLFYLYMRRVYGVTRYLPSIVLAVVLAIYLSNGQDPFVFALAAMMGGLVLLTQRRALLAALCMGVAGFANPVAVVVAAPFLIGLAVCERPLRPTLRRLALFLLPFVALRVASSLLFWEPSSYIYEAIEVFVYISYGVIGVLVMRMSSDPRRRQLETLFVSYLVLAVGFAVVPNPVGGNIGRFFLVFGVPLLLCVRRFPMPKAVSVPLICAIAFGQLITPALHYVHIATIPSTKEAFFVPALEFANLHRDPNYRSHVVALDTHWEAYWFSVNNFPITRGWYRQDDSLHNDILQRDTFTADQYVAWLQQMAVKYVYLPHAPLDISGARETQILQTSPEFSVVAQVPGWTIYELKDPQPMAQPLRHGGHAQVLAIDHQSLYLDLSRPGAYLVKVSYSPYWEVSDNVGTITRGENDFVVLHARYAGYYGITVKVTVGSSWRQLVTAF